MEALPDLKDWNLDTVRRLVAEFDHEPGQFDFKAVMRGTGPDAEGVADSIRKTACSMANTLGGFIVFGIKDARVQVSKPEDRIVGIPLHPELRAHFGTIVQRIEPEIHFDASPKAMVLESDATKGIYVVEVPHSPRRPHMLDGKFYRRGDGGQAVAMNVNEVREQVLYMGERLRKVTLLRLECLQMRVTMKAINNAHNPVFCFHRFDPSALKVLVADTCSLLPGPALTKRFLKIADLAARLNAELEAAHLREVLKFSSGASEVRDWYTPFHEGLFELEKECEDCEKELLPHFGSLESGGP